MAKGKENPKEIPPLELDDHIQIQDCKTPAYIVYQPSNTTMLAI